MEEGVWRGGTQMPPTFPPLLRTRGGPGKVWVIAGEAANTGAASPWLTNSLVTVSSWFKVGGDYSATHGAHLAFSV